MGSEVHRHLSAMSCTSYVGDSSLCLNLPLCTVDLTSVSLPFRVFPLGCRGDCSLPSGSMMCLLPLRCVCLPSLIAWVCSDTFVCISALKEVGVGRCLCLAELVLSVFFYGSACARLIRTLPYMPRSPGGAGHGRAERQDAHRRRHLCLLSSEGHAARVTQQEQQ